VVVKERVEVPEALERLSGVNVQFASVGNDVHEKATALSKPLMGVTVTVAVPVLPAVMVSVVGEVVMENPALVPVTVRVTGTLAVRVLDVPVTTTANDPEGVVLSVEMVSVDDPALVMVAGLRVHFTPLGRPLLHARVMVPVNPFSAVTVMVEIALLPAFTAMLLGLAESV
jgi:hypothetical protein